MLPLSLSVLCCLALLIGVLGNRRNCSSVKCRAVHIELADSAERSFISPAGLKRLLDKEYGGYLNVPLEGISTARMEKILQEQGFFQESVCYTTRDGVLHVEAKQCTPLLKMADGSGTWYFAREGRYFWTEGDPCKGTRAISGKADTRNELWMSRVCALGEYLSYELPSELKLSHIDCSREGNFRLRFAGMTESFTIGQPTGLEEKLSLVEKYLRMKEDGLTEGKEYTNVDVQYHGQIVCK